MLHDLSNHTKWPRKALDRLCAGRMDYHRFNARKNSAAYRNRLRCCKSVWIAAGILTIINPSANLAVALFLISTFLSFAILDEAVTL